MANFLLKWIGNGVEGARHAGFISILSPTRHSVLINSCAKISSFLLYSDTLVFCLSGRFARHTTEQEKKRSGVAITFVLYFNDKNGLLWLTLVPSSLWEKLFESGKENFVLFRRISVVKYAVHIKVSTTFPCYFSLKNNFLPCASVFVVWQEKCNR